MKPVVIFRAQQKTDVSPDALYAVLSDVNTHLVWAGEEAPDPGFRLLTLDAPTGPATVGSKWSSTGKNMKHGPMVFHDKDTVTEAVPGKVFAFTAESHLERGRKKAWEVQFKHRYEIESANGGSLIRYSCEVYPKNYIPYWLKPWMKPMTKIMVARAHNKHMVNLARMAAAKRASLG